MRRIPKSIKATVLFVLSTLILFLGIFNNYWHVLNPERLQNGVINSDRFIMGRLLKSRRDGIFSQGGLVGYVITLSESSELIYRNYPYQLYAYLTKMDFDNFDTYRSQIGGQGRFYSILDETLQMSPQGKLRLFYEGSSLLSSILLALIILWFYQEFGLTVAVFVLVSTVFSQWLVDFGKSLFWSLWAFYLPMVALVLYKIKYWYLVVLFAIGSVFLYLSRKRPFNKEKVNLILVYTTWFSILAPLSWFIIFKSHAYIHTGDAIVWQMPFTLFGFAVCGLALRNGLLDFNHWSRRIINW